MTDEIPAEARQLYVEYRGLGEQFEKVSAYLEQTSKSIKDLNELMEGLTELKTIKPGAKILAPIANGIFVDATINETAKLHVNVGGETILVRTTEEAVEMLKKQQGDLENLRSKAQKDRYEIMTRMRSIESEVK